MLTNVKAIATMLSYNGSKYKDKNNYPIILLRNYKNKL